MNQLPTKLYSADAVARLDRIAINDYGIPGYTLMRRAGRAVFNVLKENYPHASSVLVLCGAGNNAGDGYVIARLAHGNGFNVRVVSMIDPEKLRGDARLAWQHWQECGETSRYHGAMMISADVVIDALLGTGLARDVEGDWKQLINKVNQSEVAVISVDIPSGLNADTGVVSGAAISADHTVSFIGLKKGMFTASGKACSGEVLFEDLGVPAKVFDSVSVEAELLSQPSQWRLAPRRHDTHKGKTGHVLIIGGNLGMPGSVALAARAAFRSGAGLVSVVTRPEHIGAVVTVCPECMVHASVNGEIRGDLLDRADFIAIGCGLGQDAWAERLMHSAMNSAYPLVVDADALNILAKKRPAGLTQKSIITPHPGEAARLLERPTSEIQQDRFRAARQLGREYNAQVVLKGSGTIVQRGDDTFVCALGNPAMATAGMGDVLTGVIASLSAQQTVTGRDLCEAVVGAVCLHARAGDLASLGDDRGLMATDVIEHLRDAAR